VESVILCPLYVVGITIDSWKLDAQSDRITRTVWQRISQGYPYVFSHINARIAAFSFAASLSVNHPDSLIFVEPRKIEIFDMYSLACESLQSTVNMDWH
jgi:hypothetical protein